MIVYGKQVLIAQFIQHSIYICKWSMGDVYYSTCEMDTVLFHTILRGQQLVYLELLLTLDEANNASVAWQHEILFVWHHLQAANHTFRSHSEYPYQMWSSITLNVYMKKWQKFIPVINYIVDIPVIVVWAKNQHQIIHVMNSILVTILQCCLQIMKNTCNIPRGSNLVYSNPIQVYH